MTSFELRTLGAIDLRPDDGGPPPRVLHQPKRLAVLTYLVLARPRGLQRRDSLLAIFWPEFDEGRARNALSQTLHGLRSELGPDVLRGFGTQEVGVDPERVRCDVLTFETHIECERFEEALDLYGGDLLAGLHVQGTIEFAHWLDMERARLRRMARDAARKAAAALEAERPHLAVAILRRALDLFPDREDLFETMARILGETGQKSALEDAWRRYQGVMMKQLGLPPSPELQARIEALLRSRAGGPERSARGDSRAEAGAVRSIAVLPLMGLGSSSHYSSESMTEALVSELGRIRSLRVISHQSVLRFKDSDQPLREIARILGVDALIEGAVLEAGDRVRVTAQLVRANPEEHLWADAFESDAADVIAVHRDVARAVAEAVSAILSEDEERQLRASSPVEPAAFEAYLRGWQRHVTIVPDQLVKAIGMYEDAIRLDPTFALPRGSLVASYWVMAITGEIRVQDHLDRLRTLAETALALDSEATIGHTAMACVRLLTHDWGGAVESGVRAAAINPSLAMNQAHLCLMHTAQRRFEEALARAEQARRTDPLAPYPHFMVGWSLHYARRPESAIGALTGVEDLFPGYPLGWLFMAKSRFQLYEADATPDASREAMAACDRALELMPESPMALGYVAHIQARLGHANRAAKTRGRLEAIGASKGFCSPYYQACALCGAGLVDAAFAALDGIDSRASGTAWLLPVDPLVDPLRGDPRFEALLARVGLDEIAGG